MDLQTIGAITTILAILLGFVGWVLDQRLDAKLETQRRQIAADINGKYLSKETHITQISGCDRRFNSIEQRLQELHADIGKV